MDTGACPSDGRRDTRSAEARLVERLQPRVDEISRAILDRMRREFIEHADVADIDKQLASVTAITESFCGAASEGRSMVTAERERFAAIGEEAARCGLSLPTLIGGVRLAAGEGWLAANTQARLLDSESLRLEALQGIGLTFLYFVSELCDVLTLGFERQQRSSSRSGKHPARLILEELIHGSTRPTAALLEQADAAGLASQGTYGLVVVYGTDAAIDGEVIKTAAVDAKTIISGAINTGLLRGAIPHVLVLAPVRSVAAWPKAVEAGLAACTAPVRFLGSAPVDGLAAVPSAYRGVRGLLRVARALGGENKLGWESDLEVYRLLEGASVDDRQRFVDRVIGPLLSRPRGTRDPFDVDTLEALVSGATLAEIANRISVHPKTVQYRLRKIREVTGLDPAAPQDRFRLQLGVHLARLSPTTGDGGSTYLVQP